MMMFDIKKKERPVNVASVPMRSPFRYPGGKTWLIPWVRQWLRSIGTHVELIEPFAGGGIVSLTAVFENLAKRVIMVEKDEDVAAVWQTILGHYGEWLAQKIYDFVVTNENVEAAIKKQNQSIRQRAFVTILRNRLNRGGILAKGAGRIKYGENGKGALSRWYPSTLKNRIMDIRGVKTKVIFIKGDGFNIIEENMHRQDVVFFIDPPYTVAGNRLYQYCDIDHERLFLLASKVTGDFLMTYDDVAEIEQLAERHCFAVKRVLMKTTHHTEKFELLIGRDLTWVHRIEI
jgi:DNA adenine methylase